MNAFCYFHFVETCFLLVCSTGRSASVNLNREANKQIGICLVIVMLLPLIWAVRVCASSIRAHGQTLQSAQPKSNWFLIRAPEWVKSRSWSNTSPQTNQKAHSMCRELLNCSRKLRVSGLQKNAGFPCSWSAWFSIRWSFRRDFDNCFAICSWAGEIKLDRWANNYLILSNLLENSGN